MNKLITTHVVIRGVTVPVSLLKDNSNAKVTVECQHGQREIRWSRRDNLCKKCAIGKGIFNTSKKGREVSWGNKISKSKKGHKLSEAHKQSLLTSRLKKAAHKQGIPVSQATFPTKGVQYKLRLFAMSALGRNLIKKSISEQDELILNRFNYSIEQLKSHLESKFQLGMTWDNYGQWHIDHIKPESWFKYDSIDDESFKKCWSLDNLQPMWAIENIKKSNKYEGQYRQPFFYILYGQSGVGKTTLLKDFENMFYVLDVDKVPFKQIDKLIANNWFANKPIILNISVHISTTIKRYLDSYDIKTFALIESIEKVKENILSRGKRISNVESRHKRIESIARKFQSIAGDSVYIREQLIKLF
jgi:hypothetical protein